MSSDLGAQLQVRSLALKVMGADSLIQLGAKKEKKVNQVLARLVFRT